MSDRSWSPPSDRGARSRRSAPLSGSASAQTRPPCRVTMRCTLARPMPVPSNSLARAGAGTRRTACARTACRSRRRCRARRRRPRSSAPSPPTPTSIRAGSRVARVLDGVAEQVGPHLAQQGAVAVGRRQRADATTRCRGRRPRSRSGAERLLPAPRPCRPAPICHLGAADARELQQVVDEHAHLAHRLGDDVEVVAPFVVEAVRATARQQARRTR